jgi:hypothetical protein
MKDVYRRERDRNGQYLDPTPTAFERNHDVMFDLGIDNMIDEWTDG